MRRGRATSLLLGIALGTCSAWLVSWAFNPVAQLSDERLYVYVGESCPAAMNLLTQLESDAELRGRVVPLLGQESSERTLSRICLLVAEDIQNRAPWFGLLGLRDDWLCKRLFAWSVAQFEEEFVKLPSWSVGRAPVARRAESRVLAAHGVRLTAEEARPLALTSSNGHREIMTPPTENGGAPAASNRKERADIPYPLDEWRGYDIGF